MSDQLTVTFEYSPADHADALAESPHLATVRKWWNVIGAALTGLIIVVTLLKAGASPSFKATLMLFVLLLPVPATWFVMPAIQKRLQLARFRRDRAANNYGPQIRAFGADGFTASSEWREPIPWALVTRVSESKRFFLVYHAASVDPFYVPKNALSELDVERLRRLLLKHFRSSQNELQLLARAT